MVETHIQTISLSMPFGMGNVNCYLLQAGENGVLVDTGPRAARGALFQRLKAVDGLGVTLTLILLTHGDFDHSGNAAFLGSHFRIKIAMHREDWGMVQKGDMFENRSSPHWLIRKLVPVFTGFGIKERFLPDMTVDDGMELAPFGIEGRILAIPGHSKGSIGVQINGQDLICGDLLVNTEKPMVNTLMDDPIAGEASLRRLREMGIKMMYPGHGEPFRLEEVIR